MEIKFRAWDTKYKEWSSACGMACYREGDVPIREVVASADHEIIIMQFTGLHDKHGVEIYEGDVLQEEYNIKGKIIKSRPQVVTWIDSDACFGLVPSNPYAYTQLVQRDGEPERRKIIGDIYNNPELVAGDQKAEVKE